MAYYAGLCSAAGIAVYHYGLIHATAQPAACFKAFLHNNWFGASVFAGMVADTHDPGRLDRHEHTIPPQFERAEILIGAEGMRRLAAQPRLPRRPGRRRLLVRRSSGTRGRRPASPWSTTIEVGAVQHQPAAARACSPPSGKRQGRRHGTQRIRDINPDCLVTFSDAIHSPRTTSRPSCRRMPTTWSTASTR
jgi:hypothetical protein